MIAHVLRALVGLLVAVPAVAAPLTLARTQSAASHDVLAGQPLVVTWVLGNDAPHPLDAPLLTTTLAPGVTLDGAEPAAQVRGREVAVALDAIPPGGVIQVQLTLGVPAGTAAVDDGARAFASLGLRAVDAAAAATTLRATLGVDPALLAATPDAPTDDPGVLRLIGRAGCDPAALFAAVRDGFAYEPYRGALRGARGVLRTSAGNGLDRASLLVAALRACGVPARWVAGTLALPQARALIDSMFAGLAPRGVGGLALAALPFAVTSDVTVPLLEPAGLLPGAGALADPANDPLLLADAARHHWVEYDDGGGFVALDPSFATAAPGDAFAAPAATFVVVPDDEHHTVRVRLDAEIAPIGLNGNFLQIADALATALGTPLEAYDHVGNVLVQTQTVLDATFTSVELVGQPLTLGQFVAAGGFGGAGLTSQRNVYSPWLQVGDRADLIRGTDVEETISTFASDLLTALVLSVTVTSPDGRASEHERELLDRIGYAARREGGASAVAVDGAPVLTDADVTTVDVNVGGWDVGAGLAHAAATGAARDALRAGLAALPSGTPSGPQTAEIATLARRYATVVTRYMADAQVGASFGRAVLLGNALGVRGFADAPRLTLAQARSRMLDGTPQTALSLDLRKRDARVVPAPGRPAIAAPVYEGARGLADADVEGIVVEAFGDVAAVTFARFAAALAEAGGQLVPIQAASLGIADSLALPANARARIRSAAANGLAVLAPAAPAVVDGRAITMWLEVDPSTGETISVGEDGAHLAAIEYETLAGQATQGILIGYAKGFDCTGCDTGANAAQVALGALQAAGGGAAGAAAGAFGGTLAAGELITGIELPPQTPWEASGWIVGTAAKTIIYMSSNVVKALQMVDPPLSGLVLDPDALAGVPSTATATIAAGATIGGDDFDVAAAARHHRVDGASFFPSAVVAGLGAGGDAPALNFAPDAALALAGSALALDVTAGQVRLGGQPVAAPAAVALTGATGAFAVADDGATDAVTASGTFARALVLDVTPAQGTAARDAALIVAPRLRSDADDTYDLTVAAPYGWAVTIAADGTAALLPPPGQTSGTVVVRFEARSRTEPALAADATIAVDVVPPGTPRVLLALAADDTFSVPIAGTLVPLAQRITVTNLGAVAEPIDLAVDGLDAGDFTLAVASPMVGAGETAVVGLALHPGGDALLAPGTPIDFTVRATGRTSGLAATLATSVPYPAVAGVRPRLEPVGARVLPGDTVPATLVLEAAGNVATTMALAAAVPSSVTLDGLPASVTLAPGETRRLALDVGVAADATVGRSVPLGVSADLCNGVARPPCAVPDPTARAAWMGVLVGAPQTLCLLDGTITAAIADLAAPALTLQSLGLALSRLALSPGDVALQSEAIVATNATAAFLHAQGLTDRANQLLGLMAPVEAGDVAGIGVLLDDLCTALAGFSDELELVAQRAAYGFTARLTPSNRVVAPGEPAVYGLEITSTGTKTTTIDLALAGIPAGVTAALSATRVTVPAGGRDTGVTATLAAATALPSVVGFAVQGTAAGGSSGEAPGVLAVRESTIDVAAVTPAPRLAESAGTPVALVASLSNRANVARDVVVDVRVEDELGTTVVQHQPVRATVGTGEQTAVDLGPIDTASLADGAYTAVVTVRAPGGGALPGQQGRGTFLVGLPLQAIAVVEPAVVAPGTAVPVTSRVRVSGRLPRDPGTGFFDQYARVVTDADAVAAPAAALGVPDRVRAMITAGGSLTVDLGGDLARVTDGPGVDLVVFERNHCTAVHPGAYTVAVADDPAGPFVTLGSASGARELGDEFDLQAAGVTSARYVRITAVDAVEIDAVLNAHPARPGGVQLEYHLPVGFQSGVANTPAIGDLDRDGTPEIAFNVQTSFVGCEMIVIDGATKAEKFRLDMLGRTTAGAALCGEASGVAMGNLDDDPQGEIMVHAPTDNVSDVFVAMNHDGTELFRTVLPQRGVNQSSIDLANVDADPRPEILWPGGFRQDDASDGYTNGLFGQPIAVDLDGDGTPELVGASGGAAFSNLAALRTDGTAVWTSPRLADGLGAKATSRPAVADLDGDGRPDFAAWAANLLGHTQGVHAVRHDGTMLWRVPIPVGPRLCTEHPTVSCTTNTDCPTGTCKLYEHAASEPAIADVNGDGRPEVVLWLRDAGDGDRGSILAFEGATGRELWRVEANDPGGIEPNVSTADLDGDGAAEVLWNGSCDGFTIVDGSAGAVVYRDPRVASGSGHDSPAIADADADGRLEVVTGDAQGLYVFGAGSGWASGRAVWNQSAYSITNVGDDLTIPATPPEPWRFHNTARFQGPRQVDLAHATVDVTHTLAGDATFAAADVVPPATSVTGSTVVWQAAFPTAMGAAFDVPATLDAIAPGETRTVSTGGRVEAEIVLLDGATVQVTLPLAPATVSSPHVIAVAPASQTADAGTAATYDVTLTNAGDVAETFALSVFGIDPAFVDLPPAVAVEAGASVVLPVVVTVPADAPGGVVDFALVVAGDAGTTDDAGAQLVVRGIAPPALPGGIRVTVAPAAATVGRGGAVLLDVVVTSGLDRSAMLALSAVTDDLAASVADASLAVPPHGTATTRVLVEAATDAVAGVRSLAVTAADPADAQVTDTGTAAIAVSDRGVQVSLSPDTASSTSDGRVLLDAVVANTGVADETFTLAAGGPLGALATLGAASVSLPPGATATVPVTLAGLDVLLQQRSFVLLTAQATSDPAVAASDASAVDVAVRRALAVQVTPDDAVHAGPGTVALALAIANTGNACDERYHVAVTSMPPGIAGGITPSAFVVPAGQTANLRLDAVAAALGTYDVTVRVTTDATNPACPPLAAAEGTDVVTLAFVDGGTTTTTTTTPVSTTSTTLPGIDPFVLYSVKPARGTARPAPFAPVLLTDAFGSASYRAIKPKQLGLPGDADDAGTIDPVTHLLDYQVKPERGQPAFGRRSDVEVTNACGTLRLDVSRPSGLLVPALVDLDGPPPAPTDASHQLDQYLCYKARPQKKLADGSPLPKLPKGMQIDVTDQFQTRRYDLKKVTRYCTPVSSSGTPAVVRRPDAGFVCYRAKAATRRIAQRGCIPAALGDRGAAITPKQPKHTARTPIYVGTGVGSAVLSSVKEAELCLPSSRVPGTPATSGSTR